MICVVEELLLQTGFVRVMVDRSWATCRRAQPSRTFVGCLLVLTFSSSKTLNSPLDRVGDISFFLRRKFKVSFEELCVVSVFAISDFEHVHYGGRGGGQLVCWLWRREGWAFLR